MSRISDSTLLSIWEEGVAAHPLDRALGLISALDRTPRDELARLPIAARDKRLFAATALLFGPTIRVLATCAECGAETELSFAAEDVLGLEEPSPGFELDLDGRRLTCRMPDSRDLAAALRSTDARRTLLSRLVDADDLASGHLDAVEAAVQARAGAEMLELAHTCAECGVSAVSPFDVADYLWRQVAAQAQRLLWDIHLLASAYGWTGGEILGLGPRRRAAHVAMVTT